MWAPRGASPKKGEVSMTLLNVKHVSKSFGGKHVFEDISFQINSHEKVALIGQNGVGKSTLLKCIVNDESPDAGDIFIYGNTTVGYLSQQVIEKPEGTLLDEMTLVFSDLVRMEHRLQALAEKLENDPSQTNIERYGRAEADFARLGGYDFRHEIDAVLSRFGFSEKEYDRPVRSFSGGEKTRIAFAKLLLRKPDLLLLDEPTNHMDIAIVEWLEEHLKRYDGSILLVTHDKYFINRVCDRVLEMEDDRLETYDGNYDDYEEEKILRYEQRLKAYEKQQKKIAHYQSFVDRFRYKASKAKSAQDRIKKIERMQTIDKPTRRASSIHLDIKSKRPTEVVVLTADKLSIGYDRAIQENISFSMRGFEKIGILGPNGTGKTTFIKTVLGDLSPLSGDLSFHKNMDVGYFDQQLETLDNDKTVFATIHDDHPRMTVKDVHDVLAGIMFYGDDVRKEVRMLSGGERVRLQLLKMLLFEPELLVLDEPTNHLDIESSDVIETLLADYNGPMLFITHDRHFLNAVADRLMIFSDRDVRTFDGDYDRWRKQREQEKAERKAKERKHRKQRAARSSEGDIDRDAIERRMATLEEEIRTLRETRFDPEVYQDQKRYDELEKTITGKENELNTLLDRLLEADRT